LADIPNPEAVKVPDGAELRSRFGPSSAALDSSLGPDPDLGLEPESVGTSVGLLDRPEPDQLEDPEPLDHEADSVDDDTTAEATDPVTEETVDDVSSTPKLRVVKDLDHESVEPEPIPFDLDSADEGEPEAVDDGEGAWNDAGDDISDPDAGDDIFDPDADDEIDDHPGPGPETAAAVSANEWADEFDEFEDDQGHGEDSDDEWDDEFDGDVDSALAPPPGYPST